MGLRRFWGRDHGARFLEERTALRSAGLILEMAPFSRREEHLMAMVFSFSESGSGASELKFSVWLRMAVGGEVRWDSKVLKRFKRESCLSVNVRLMFQIQSR